MGAFLLEGMVEVREGALQNLLEKQGCPGQGASAYRGAFLGVETLVGVLGGKHQEEACLGKTGSG